MNNIYNNNNNNSKMNIFEKLKFLPVCAVYIYI